MPRPAGLHAALLLAALACGACNESKADTPEKAAAPPVFTAESDDRLRSTLATAEIEAVMKGRGGRSLAFKLSFSGGVQGYFKPEQTFGANWNSEPAAYYLDRELGLGRVPPAVGRRISWQRLRPYAERDPRLEEVVVRKGSVRGSLVYWIPEDLVRAELPEDWPGWLRINPRISGSPFHSPGEYWGNKRRRSERKLLDPPAPAFADRPAELSDMVLFDYLIGNLDRWGSNNVNVLVLARSKRLVFLDNANGFELRQKPSKLLEARLSAVQRFRKQTITAIRALDVKRLEARMASDPLAPLLSAEQLAALEQRRQRVLDHVAQVEKQYGASALPW